MLELSGPDSSVRVDPLMGGRVASLRIGGTEVIVGPTSESGTPRDPFEWGMYPMVPFAGRIRRGRFTFAGEDHALPARRPPHAIHGTVDQVPWEVDSVDRSSVVLGSGLGGEWPFDGRVTHEMSLGNHQFECVLSLTAGETMPAQVGWHPWFRRPATVAAGFAEWLPRDLDGMPGAPTTIGIPDLAGSVDDCFVAGALAVSINVDGLDLTLESDCSHWVVYTGASHGVCVEPQSGPPNEIEASPFILRAGRTLRRRFMISW